MRHIVLAGLAWLALVGGAAAQDCLRAASTAALPGGIALQTSPASGHSAWYEDATDAYGHDIMGALPDARTLRFAIWDGARCFVHAVDAGEAHVFEDTAPRLVDLEGDGMPEVVAVRSSMSRGAQLAVYGLRRGQLTLLDATPPIGMRNRWLAPAAWADLDGDGAVELAYVDRPHLAKTLRVWRWRNGGLEPVAAAAGVTNHAIGEEGISGGLRRCGPRPEMVLQSADRSRLIGITLRDDTLRSRDLGPAGRMDEVLACSE